ncbi:hypothetical protein K461DRAFT_276839 [Myriangium duriaei CBS 260.36]|uniref:Cyclin domain-containing protein n=1 Tax=Myriangium duriaei CBS 260.36 TaxID=1168546 RepID=A0A9P4ML37_9PEZI|nr:hypothetical protein K461DRAFT_276839 [Myriangium duriaei CBS 260.36]
MAPAVLVSDLSHLANSSATPDQLARSASQVQGVPSDVEAGVRYYASTVIQAAGILLRLPQPTIAEAIIIFTRFWLGPTGGNLLEFNAQDVAAAALYLVIKPGPYPLNPRQILNAFFYVRSSPAIQQSWQGSAEDAQIPLYSEGSYQVDRAALINAESQILKTLGFQTQVALPHPLCLYYLQTLGILTADEGHELARRAHAHLNSALFSPQLIYLTHQPNSLAVAAIYLAARETEVNLPQEPWWEVFDVDREELGFLVVALTSIDGFVEEQKARYSKHPPPLTAQEIRAEIELQA